MNRRHPVKLLEFLAVLLVVLVARAAWAQSLGSLQGQVTGQGAALSGVTVRVVCGNVKQTAQTDAAGNFTIGALPPGTCTVAASLPGYRGASSKVKVQAGQAAQVKLVLAAVANKGEATKDAVAGRGRGAELAESRIAPAPVAKMPMPSKPSGAYKVKRAPSAVALGGPAQPMTLEREDQGNTEAYARIDDNPFRKVSQAPLSTFAADVDTASYSNLRRFLSQGTLPPKDAVRLEELINYFSYDYPAPKAGEPLSVTTEVGPSPWSAKHQLVRVGLAAPPIDDRQVPARNLVFLLDVSGSMQDPAKLPLLKQAMNLLVDNLRPQDTVAIAVYAGASGLALPPTSGKDKDKIRQAIFALEAGGSTNGAAGIQLAYNIATAHFLKGGINRVILCTDGDFNVGVTSEGELTRLIEQERERGVFLTVLGFGMGNLKDSTMEKLANRGNGNYAYLDSLMEARKVLVKEAGATLVTVAKDVKLQVEFNPALVAGYRLVGYENRMLRDEDFNDDKKDAGDLGAGHTVTALYEIVPVGVAVPGDGKVDELKYQGKAAPSPVAAASGELLTVKVRYKAPDGKTSKLMSHPVQAQADWGKRVTSEDFRWAAAIASMGMMLRDSAHRGNLSWKEVRAMAAGSVGKDVDGYRKQALELIDVASKLRP